MAKWLPSGDPALSRLVERQMRNWELARRQRGKTPAPERRDVEDFVCVSRMVGIEAHRIAAGVGERLGWPVFDREILDAMAGDDEARRQIYKTMDQRDLSWWEATLRPLMQHEFHRNDYYHRLCETLLSLARQGSGVFVGRGADRVLPRDRGFRVRLVAPRELRVGWFAEARGLSPAEARRQVEAIERERAEFLRNHFGVEPNDPLRHDLTINLERFRPDRAVDLILRAHESFGGD